MFMGKIDIYIRENLVNVARQAGVSVGSWKLRGGLYGVGLGVGSVPVSVYDGYSDGLMVDGVDVGNGIVLEADGSRIAFRDALVDVKKRNNVVRTSVVDRSGSIKERIQAEDYDVLISGSLFGERERFPYAELQLLNMILSTSRSIRVASAYLCVFDIERLVLSSADFDQSKLRYFNVMPFRLMFNSDMDYDFLVVED